MPHRSRRNSVFRSGIFVSPNTLNGKYLGHDTVTLTSETMTLKGRSANLNTTCFKTNESRLACLCGSGVESGLTMDRAIHGPDS